MPIRRSLATLAALLLILVVGVVGLYAARAATPAASASESPRPTPAAYLLPQGCSYVGGPVADKTVAAMTTWEFDCGATPDLSAIERLTPVFAPQGWTLCFTGLGRGFWAKGTTETIVGQSAVGHPVISQLPRQAQDCP